MNYDLYSQQILELWRNPINKGEIKNPTYSSNSNNPLCGDKLELFIKTKKTGRQTVIVQAKFNGEGCAISQASASLLTTHIIGLNISELKNIDTNLVRKLLGVPISANREKCAFLILDALERCKISNFQ